MSDRIFFTEYTYTGLTGNVYHPYFDNGNWYVIPHNPTTFLNMVYLCRIPDEDALLLKLKYGVESALL